jgi:hypothetical protein
VAALVYQRRDCRWVSERSGGITGMAINRHGGTQWGASCQRLGGRRTEGTHPLFVRAQVESDAATIDLPHAAAHTRRSCRTSYPLRQLACWQCL